MADPPDVVASNDGGGPAVSGVSGSILGQTGGETGQGSQGPHPRAINPQYARSATTPTTAEVYLEPVVAVEKWKGARLSGMTFEEWRKYHFQPALVEKKQQYADARPLREWTAFAEYKFLDNCVDHSAPGIAEARRLLIDQGFFEAEVVNYREILDHYKGHLQDVGRSAAQEFQRQIVSVREGGFNKAPSELAREVRRAHVARYGTANYRTANELLYDLLVVPWATVNDLKQRESVLRWELQALRFSSLDNLNEIAVRVAEMEDKALREETNALIMRRDSQLQQQILGAHKETRVINGQTRPRCDVCTALGEEDQFHLARYCPARKAIRQGRQRAKESERLAADSRPSRPPASRLHTAHVESDDEEAAIMAAGQAPRRGGSGSRWNTDNSQDECWNCKKKGHRFTACPHKITDESCLRRLRVIPREYEERKAYLERHPLQSSAQARQVDAAQPVPVLKRPGKEADSSGSVQFAAKPDDSSSDEDYWLSSSNTVSRAHVFPAPALAAPAPPAPPRPRGRPRVLPQGTAQDPGLRMQQPGWDAQRERLNHLPQGFAPAGAAPQQSAPPQRDAAARDIRTQQLLHALRAAFQHARFPSLATTAVTDGGERQRQRWVNAREEVLQGQLNVRDHCAVAWQAAVDDVVRRFLSQARLTWADISQIDLRSLCGQAVRSVYGIDLQGAPVPPAAAVQQPPVQLVQQPQSPVNQPQTQSQPVVQPVNQPQPAAQQEQPAADDVEDVVGDYLERLREWGRQQDRTVPTDPQSADAAQMAMTVLDLTDRQPLLQDDPVMAQRKRLISEARPHPTVRRRWMAMVDTDITRVTVGGVDVHLALLDSGCDWFSIHTSVAVKAGYTYAQGEQVTVQGSTGAAMAHRTEQPVTMTLNPGTNWEMDWTVPSAVVHADDRLPEVIVDTGTLAAMMAVMHFGKWQLTYPVDPDHLASGGGAHAVVPLTPVQPLALTKDLRGLQRSVELGGGGTGSTIKRSASSPAIGSASTAVIFFPDDSHFDYDDQSAPPRITMAAARQHVPSFQEQRDSLTAKGRRLPFGPHDEATIKAVGSLLTAKDPKDNIYITNLSKVTGDAGAGLRNLYAAPGMLTTLMQHMADGLHFSAVYILEKDRMLHSIVQQQLEQLHEAHPQQLPRSAFQRAFDWAEGIGHDISQLTGAYLMETVGELDEVHAEPPCQGVSAYGLQLGLLDSRSGIMVDLAAALLDYQHMLAQRRHIKDWAHAPAQFGFVIENVTPAPRGRRSQEVDEFFDFMERVFGVAVRHHPDQCGSLTTRTACWWTNMFPVEYYELMEPEFHCEPAKTFAEVVKEATDGRLEPQIATPEMQRKHPRNIAGQPQQVQPKYVSRVDNVMQILQPDGQPGPGMLKVVGSEPPRFERTPAVVRERALQAPPGFYTRAELGLTEEDMIRRIGNICSPISVSVITRIRVAFAQQARQLQWLKLQRIAPDWDDEHEGPRIIEELRREVQHAITLEEEYARAAAVEADHAYPKVTAKEAAKNRERHRADSRQAHQRGTVPAPPVAHQAQLQVSKAKHRRLEEKRQAARDKEQHLQRQRERVARAVRQARWSNGDRAVINPKPARGNQAGTLFMLFTLLTLLSTSCAQCYTAGAACGADAMRTAMKTARPASTASTVISESLLRWMLCSFRQQESHRSAGGGQAHTQQTHQLQGWISSPVADRGVFPSSRPDGSSDGRWPVRLGTA